MRLFMANRYAGGVCYSVDYEAKDEIDAERMADEHDWEYLGEFLDEPCPDDVVAMLEFAMFDPVLH